MATSAHHSVFVDDETRTTVEMPAATIRAVVKYAHGHCALPQAFVQVRRLELQLGCWSEGNGGGTTMVNSAGLQLVGQIINGNEFVLMQKLLPCPAHLFRVVIVG